MDERKKKDLLDKVKQANQKEEKISFKIEFEGKVISETEINIGSYHKDVLKNGPDYYYFFKDVTNKLEELLAKKHKELIWKELEANK